MDDCQLGGSTRQKLMARLAQIVDARYRERGYRVFWLTLSQRIDPLLPNNQFVDDRVDICPEDTLLTSGLTVQRYNESSYRSSFYWVINQMKAWPEEFVVGGFHLWDCVDKFAAEASRRGIPTRVDEDTTNYFIGMASYFRKYPPILRETEEYREVLREFIEAGEEHRPGLMQRNWSSEKTSPGLPSSKGLRRFVVGGLLQYIENFSFICLYIF